MTKNGGYVAFESPDGKMLYYSKEHGISALWKMPVEGGVETQVLKSVLGMGFALSRKGIYFEHFENDGTPRFGFFRDGIQASVDLFLFETGKVKPVAKIDRPLTFGLSVSPDERYLLYSELDQSGTDLMMIEGSGTRNRTYYSQRNTFADSAVQTKKTAASATTSPMCADHASPFQIP